MFSMFMLKGGRIQGEHNYDNIQQSVMKTSDMDTYILQADWEEGAVHDYPVKYLVMYL